MDQPAILDSLKKLHKNGATFITTNYDDVLEKHLDMAHFDKSDPHALIEYQRGSLDAVFHPHGHWRNGDNIILSAQDYWGVKGDSEVQETLRHVLATKTVLFVGCGSGLSDPNFGKLLDWIGDKHKRRGATHYLLLRRGEQNPVAQLPLNHVVVSLSEFFMSFMSFLSLFRYCLSVAIPFIGHKLSRQCYRLPRPTKNSIC